MADGAQTDPSFNRSEHVDENISAKRVANYVWDGANWVRETQPGGGGGASTIADGADVAEGATTDVAVTSDANGTVSGKLRGLVKILADVWDSANHRLKVDGSGVTQPVSLATAPTTPVTGTFWQATQPVSGTFYQATQPVSAASLPLPTGASTAAKQPALGTAGTPSADVITVQGVTSMTALKVDGSAASISGTLINNQQTVTASAVALPSNTLTQGVTVEALSTNLVSVFVGAAGVTTSTGLELPPGSAVTLPLNNTNLVYVRCASGSPVVSYVGV